MIIIAKLDYYDGERKILPMEADSPKDAYEKVRGVIAKFREDCEEYRKWENDVFYPAYDKIIERLFHARDKRKSFDSCEVNFEIDAKRTEFFGKLTELEDEIDKIEQERTDLCKSRREPVEGDYANFRLNGLDVSDYNFVTLDEWLKEMVEIYE